MRFARLAAGAAALALIGGGAAVASLSSDAAVTPQVIYTGAGANSTAGWTAFSPDLVTFTHEEAYIGSAGNSTWENLPIASDLATANPGDDVTLSANDKLIQGGAGLQLCDRNTGHHGHAGQIGLVQVAPGSFDLVEALGDFGNKASNKSGDVCDNGLLGEAAGSKAWVARVLLTGVGANDTVKAGILFDPINQYWGDGRWLPAGTFTFYATDLSNLVNTNTDTVFGPDFFNTPCATNEADAGVVTNTVPSPALTNLPVPAPNGGLLSRFGTSELVRFAHVKVNANNAINGKGEVQGSFQSNLDWTTNPVAATTDGTSAGLLYLDPSQFRADNFYVAGGLGLVS